MAIGEAKMRPTGKPGRASVSPSPARGNATFAGMVADMLERHPGKTPASANVSKLGAAVIRAGRTASALARGLAAAWVCVIFPTLALAQTGEASIGVGLLPQDLSPWGMFQHADPIVK